MKIYNVLCQYGHHASCAISYTFSTLAKAVKWMEKEKLEYERTAKKIGENESNGTPADYYYYQKGTYIMRIIVSEDEIDSPTGIVLSKDVIREKLEEEIKVEKINKTCWPGMEVQNDTI